MKKRILTLIVLGVLNQSALSQQYEKVYLSASDSTKFYFKVIPDSEAKGLLILLPGTRGNSEWPLKTTKIPYIAADRGIVTIMINYELWLCWLRDDVLQLLNASIKDVVEKHHIPANKCVIGGFSAGGNMALSFTELAFEDSSRTEIIPRGVFAFQPPLDLVELYSADHQIIKGYYCFDRKTAVTEEVLGINGSMTKHLGTPWDNPENYYYHSPFLIDQRYEGGGKAKYLKNIAVRIYSGYNETYFDRKIENCGLYLPTSIFFISYLKFSGNESATFKNQYDKDYHPDGGEKFRGRHAWLGFDSNECVDWMTRILYEDQ